MQENSGKEQMVIAAVDDMFFASKIDSSARSVGIKLAFVRNPKELAARLAEVKPAMIIFDLNSKDCDPVESIRRIRSDPGLADTHLLGFFSHVQTELEQSAREAGCDVVIPRSAFSRQLAEILQKASRSRPPDGTPL